MLMYSHFLFDSPHWSWLLAWHSKHALSHIASMKTNPLIFSCMVLPWGKHTHNHYYYSEPQGDSRNFGSFWEPWRGSGEGLGRSWGLLGGSWGLLGAHGLALVVLTSTWGGNRTHLRSKRESRWLPNRDRKRIKIDVKNEDEKRSSSTRFWGGLKTILDHFEWVSQRKKGEKTLEILGSRENLHFGKRYGFERRLGPCKRRLGLNLSEFVRPKPSKMRLKKLLILGCLFGLSF